jgi:hypothetical protein
MYLNSGLRLLTQVQDYVETLRNLNEDYLNIAPQDAHISPLGNRFLTDMKVTFSEAYTVPLIIFVILICLGIFLAKRYSRSRVK